MSARLVIRGGRVHTVDPTVPHAEAVAVRGERIVAVGRDDDVAALIDPHTEVIEAAGATVLRACQSEGIHSASREGRE